MEISLEKKELYLLKKGRCILIPKTEYVMLITAQLRVHICSLSNEQQTLTMLKALTISHPS